MQSLFQEYDLTHIAKTIRTPISSATSMPDDSCLVSPAYLALTGRYGYFNANEKGSILSYFIHPHDSEWAMILPMLGPTRPSLFKATINHLNNSYRKICFGRFQKHQLDVLQKQLMTDAFFWCENKDHLVMDWAYPFHILDTKAVSKAEGPAYRKLRQKVKDIEKKPEKLTELRLIDGGCDILKMLRYVLKIWQASMIWNDKDIDDINSYYELLFSYINNQPAHFDGLIFIDEHDMPAGFSIWEKPFHNQTVFLANLCDIKVAHLSYYQRMRSCAVLAQEGTLHLNIGGSETKGLDQAKRHVFSPAKSIQLYTSELHIAENENQIPQNSTAHTLA